jgi:hypothetical protein
MIPVSIMATIIFSAGIIAIPEIGKYLLFWQAL